MRFRKSKKIGPFRISASKSGLGFSAGAGPMRISHGADGKTRRTFRVPGAGLYDTQVVGDKGRVAVDKRQAAADKRRAALDERKATLAKLRAERHARRSDTLADKA